MADIVSLKTPAATVNPTAYRESYGYPDPAYDGVAAEMQYPQDFSVQGQSASGPAPNQADRTFVSEYTNPTNTDQLLYTVPNISTTLSATMTTAGNTTMTVASAAGIIPGMYLIVDAGGAHPEMVKVTAVNQSTGVVSAVFRYVHASGAIVTCARTFYLTDFVVTTSSGTPHKVILKCRSTISSGSITTGSHAVTFANPAVSPQIGDLFYVGSTVYIDDPSSGTYEAVVVTAVSRNTAGVLTGFTATFAQSHAANVIVSFPIAASWVNSTKGLEVVGQESQPTAPPGSTLALTFGAAVTGDVMVNIAGFEQ